MMTNVEMGRKGGKARSEKLTEAELSAIGRLGGIAAAKARAAATARKVRTAEKAKAVT
jgi:hypothetical protein